MRTVHALKHAAQYRAQTLGLGSDDVVARKRSYIHAERVSAAVGLAAPCHDPRGLEALAMLAGKGWIPAEACEAAVFVAGAVADCRSWRELRKLSREHKVVRDLFRQGVGLPIIKRQIAALSRSA